MENNDHQKHDREQREPFDWGSLFRRKDRPLPPRGCSVAFYIFLLLLFALLIVSYILYKNSIN